MTNTNNVLDASLVVALRDPLAGPDLHRVLTALCASSGKSYMQEYEGLQRVMMDSLHGNEGQTVREAIKARDDVKLSDVRDDLATLEQGAKVADAARERALRLLSVPDVDAHGRVKLLDSSAGPNPWADSGLPPQRVPTGDDGRGRPAIGRQTFESVMNEPMMSGRLFRARQLQPGFEGPDGARQFQRFDQDHAEAGFDLVAGWEAEAAIAQAYSAAQTVGAELDQAFRAGRSPKDRRKLLDKAAKRSVKLLDQQVGRS
jgi:hypothetical protein